MHLERNPLEIHQTCLHRLEDGRIRECQVDQDVLGVGRWLPTNVGSGFARIKGWSMTIADLGFRLASDRGGSSDLTK